MIRALHWKFGQYLREHAITPYRLEQALQGKASRRLPYDWSKGAPERLHLDVLAKVLGALESLTGKPVRIEEIMEFEAAPAGTTDENANWLSAELVQELPSYDWGKQGAPKGEQIKYVPGKGFIVRESTGGS
jgi:hypothetical protein